MGTPVPAKLMFKARCRDAVWEVEFWPYLRSLIPVEGLAKPLMWIGIASWVAILLQIVWRGDWRMAIRLLLFFVGCAVVVLLMGACSYLLKGRRRWVTLGPGEVRVDRNVAQWVEHVELSEDGSELSLDLQMGGRLVVELPKHISLEAVENVLGIGGSKGNSRRTE